MAMTVMMRVMMMMMMMMMMNYENALQAFFHFASIQYLADMTYKT